MQKIDLIVASIYKGIANKIKNDTPYFNTLMLISFAFVIHFTQILVVLKIFKIDLLKNLGTPTFLVLFIIMIALSVFFLTKRFPIKKIIMIQVNELEIKKYYNSMIVYFMFSISILMGLFILLKNKMGL